MDQEQSLTSAPSIILLLSTFLFLFLSLFLLYRPKKKLLLRLPPSPPRLPIIGNLHQLSSLPHRSLRDLSKKFGPIMTVYLGQAPALVISSADAAKEVLKNQSLVFASRPATAASAAISYDHVNVSFAPYSDRYKQARKFSVLHLFNSTKVHSFKRIRGEEVGIMVKKIEDKPSPLRVNLSEILHQFSSRLICRVVAGECEEIEERSRRFRELVDVFTALFSAPRLEELFPSLAWVSELPGAKYGLRKAEKTQDKLLEEILVEHEKRGSSSEAADFVDLLISSEYGFSRTEVKAIFVDMIAAGTDTAYSLLEWAMSELVKNPDLMKKTKTEVKDAVSGKTKVEEEDLNEMPLLKAVIKEALRLHMPAPLLVPRVARENTTVNGYDVPAGTKVFVNAWAIATNEEIWDSPEEFKPERFLNGEAADYLGNDMNFLPFGAGRRICPGMGFGLSEVEIALASLLYHFDWDLPDRKAPEELDMAETVGITVRRRTPLVLVAVPLSEMEA